MQTLKERLDSKWSLNKVTGCHEWVAGKFADGYGAIWDEKQNFRAHRVSYELSVGPIPKGLLVCHRCDNPKCVNPDHLFLGTSTDNMRDMVEKGRNFNQKGESHNQAKLTEEDVLGIRSSNEDWEELSTIYKVSVCTIRDINYRRSWKHI